MADVTEVLNCICNGEPAANDQLLASVYDELRKLAMSRLYAESPCHTLQPTDLVNEAFIRLVSSSAQNDWHCRAHFFGAAAEAMRRILVDHARAKKSLRRGGQAKHVGLLDDCDDASASVNQEVLDVHEVLDCFEAEHPEKSQLVKLRYFAGVTIPQAAEMMNISTATANRYWAFARAWLYDRISGPDDNSPARS